MLREKTIAFFFYGLNFANLFLLEVQIKKGEK
jgi:hypothetical protein